MTQGAPEIAWPAIAAVLLLTVVALAIHVWLKRRGVLPGANNPIKLIATKSLGAKRAVAVVEIESERFLLGLSDDSVALLSQLNATPGQRAKTLLQPLSASVGASANAK
jgi:flagellar biogenesis protein FliO